MIPGLLEQLPALEASLETDGSNRNVMCVADALRLAGRPERAADLLRTQVHREPARIAPRVLLAWCLQDVGNIDDARAMLDTVRSIDPGNPFAREPEPSRRELAPEPQPALKDPSPRVAEPPPVVAVPATATPDHREEPPPPVAAVPAAATPVHREEPPPPVVPVPATVTADHREEPPPPPAAVVDDPEAEAEPERALTEAELREIPPGPLYSATLAEIFERQGFEEKAIEIFEEILRQHPERQDLRERIVDLRARVAEDAH